MMLMKRWSQEVTNNRTCSTSRRPALKILEQIALHPQALRPSKPIAKAILIRLAMSMSTSISIAPQAPERMSTGMPKKPRSSRARRAARTASTFAIGRAEGHALGRIITIQSRQHRRGEEGDGAKRLAGIRGRGEAVSAGRRRCRSRPARSSVPDRALPVPDHVLRLGGVGAPAGPSAGARRDHGRRRGRSVPPYGESRDDSRARSA